MPSGGPVFRSRSLVVVAQDDRAAHCIPGPMVMAAGPANRCLDMPSTPNLRARVRRPIMPAMAELDQIYCYPVLVYLANPRGRPVDTDINAGADYVSLP